MSDTVRFKIAVDDGDAASKLKQNAEATRKATAEQLEHAKTAIAASEKRLQFLEKELIAAKRFYEEQKEFARRAIREKEKLIELEMQYEMQLRNARNVAWTRSTPINNARYIAAGKRLEEHQSLMRTAIPDLDAAPESVRAAAAEVKNLAESIATQRIELRSARTAAKGYAQALKELAKDASNGRLSVVTLRQAFNGFARLLTGDFKGAALSFRSLFVRMTAQATTGGSAVITAARAALLNPWTWIISAMSAPVILKIRHDRESKQAIEDAKELAKILGQIQKEHNTNRNEWINEQKRRDGTGPLGQIQKEAAGENSLETARFFVGSWEKTYNESFEAERRAAQEHLNAEGRLAAFNEKSKKSGKRDDGKKAELEEKVKAAKKRLDAARSLTSQYFEALEVWRKREKELSDEEDRKEREAKDKKKSSRKERRRRAKERREAKEAYEKDLAEHDNRVFLSGLPNEKSKLQAEHSRLTAERSVITGTGLEADRQRLAIDKELLSVNERLNAIKNQEKDALRDIKEESALIGLERKDWLKKRIGQVRKRFREESDPVERARLALTGKQLTHELKTLLSEDSGSGAGALGEPADTRRIGPNGVPMNDMRKVSAGGVKMVAPHLAHGLKMVEQPFGSRKRETWKQASVLGSVGLNEIFDMMHGQHQSQDPAVSTAENTRKAVEHLEVIANNLKGVQ
jgi:hypothetical protein